ncbi:hypothetical protein DAERI_020331 [Deinococcus aerius]|uniref:Uncharacterized protein n=1 Tax=Deinococcus aerius TaxID=200253 RepID=A0A2I9CSS1_9DEIO|nr:hypothetical protein DAERI_020331 [Deinococcus aerius]
MARLTRAGRVAYVLAWERLSFMEYGKLPLSKVWKGELLPCILLGLIRTDAERWGVWTEQVPTCRVFTTASPTAPS